jgi:hypothetical protein
MTTEVRFGSVDSSVDTGGYNGFALFGHTALSEEDAARDGVELFSARMSIFDMRIQSAYDHLLLKEDLVEHINNLVN